MQLQSSRGLVFNLLLTALAPAIWGSTYIVATELLPSGRPITAAVIRCLPAGILLALACRHLPPQRLWPRLLILSFLNIGAFQALLFVAAYRLPGGLAAVLGAGQPLMVLALAWGIDGKRPAMLTAAGAALGVAGMAGLFLSPGVSGDAIGIAAALTGAASMAAGTYLTRRWRPELPVLALTGAQLLLGGLMLLPLAWALEEPLPALAPLQWTGYAYLSLVGALIAYALWFRGVQRLPPVTSTSLGLLSPVTAVVLGWLLLDQRLTGFALLGLAVVLLSILLVQWQTASVAAATPSR